MSVSQTCRSHVLGIQDMKPWTRDEYIERELTKSYILSLIYTTYMTRELGVVNDLRYCVGKILD